MPSLLGRFLLTIFCLCGSPAWGNEPLADEAIVLNDNVPAVQVRADVRSWIDEGSHATSHHSGRAIGSLAIRA